MEQHTPIWKTEPYWLFRERISGHRGQEIPRDARIRYTDCWLEDYSLSARWPLYAVRGRPVSEEQTGMRADGLAIAAPGKHGPEQIAGLETAEHELLFVLADYVVGEEARALAACRARLQAEGKTPFFVRVCHGDKSDTPVPEGLFDGTVVCSRWNDLPLSRPAEIVSAFLHDEAEDLYAEDALRILRRPGPMFCFEKSASREGWPGQALEKLCNELEIEAAVGRARFGGSLRVFVQLICSADIGLDEIGRCLEALTENSSKRHSLWFQTGFEPQGSLPDNALVVRGLIGAWDDGGKEKA